MHWCLCRPSCRPSPRPELSVDQAALERVAQFRRYMTTERRLSAHTDTNYARDLAALVKFCDLHGLQDWGAVDSQHIRTFASHSPPNAPRTATIQRATVASA